MGRITELREGDASILCALHFSWADRSRCPARRELFHVYLVRDGLIAEIQAFDDRASALVAAGIVDA